MKNTKVKNFIFLQAIFLVYSFTGIVAKKASQFDVLSFNFILWYGMEILIIAVYAVLWQQAIKSFDIVTAYASKGIVIIWMLLWSVLLFNESIKFNNIIGAAVIILGIGLVAADGN